MSNDDISGYLVDLHRHSMLTVAQAQPLWAAVRSWQELESIKPKKSTEEDWANIAEIHVNELRKRIALGQRAKQRLVEGNLRLVVSIAKKYNHLGNIADRIQEGNIGLCRAVDKFDPSAGIKFSTYAYYWIKQGINRQCSQQTRNIRLPVHFQEALRVIGKAGNQLRSKGEPETLENLAEELQALGFSWTPEKIQAALRTELQQRTLSLNSPARKDDDESNLQSLEDTIADPASDPWESLMYYLSDEAASKYLQILCWRNREIFVKIFGLDGNHRMNLSKVAKEFGLSRERVRQIKNQSIRKIRKYILEENKRANEHRLTGR